MTFKNIRKALTLSQKDTYRQAFTGNTWLPLLNFLLQILLFSVPSALVKVGEIYSKKRRNKERKGIRNT
jgi:hypothetical protein